MEELDVVGKYKPWNTIDNGVLDGSDTTRWINYVDIANLN